LTGTKELLVFSGALDEDEDDDDDDEEEDLDEEEELPV